MRCFIITSLSIAVLCGVSSAQSAQCPAGMVCISQDAANAAASNARELAAVREAVKVRDAALAEKDRIIADNRSAAEKNQADLTAALHRTEIELASKTGQLIGCEANGVSQRAIITALLPMVRPKTNGIKIF